MANLDAEFRNFHDCLGITQTKESQLQVSKENIREVVKAYFKEHHLEYKPMFYTQGSSAMKTVIRTKDDTCDVDDGVYFTDNPDGVSARALQERVQKAVESVTDSKTHHKKKCITVDYKAGYNIDLPVYLFDYKVDVHPQIAVKDEGWVEDDPREMVQAFRKAKRDHGDQLVRIVKYLKAWCDHKREKMPSGLAMTILAMNNFVANKRDDMSLKFTLIAIRDELRSNFRCCVPATPYDDIFSDYDDVKKRNFLSNLDNLISDAREAVDNEKNHKAASLLWQKHLGCRFPEGQDKTEKEASREMVSSIIGSSKPYAK